MKIYRVIKSCLLALCTILLAICCFIPTATITSGGTANSIYLFSLLSVGVVSLQSSQISAVTFYGILSLIVIFIGPLLLISENKIVKLFSAAVSLSSLVVAEYFIINFSELQKSVGTNSRLDFGGAIFWLIVEILILIIVLIDLYFAFIHDRVIQLITKKQNPETIVMAKLQENKQLFEAGLITKEEFDERRAAILKGE